MNATTTLGFVLPVRPPSAESLGYYGTLKRAAGVHGGLSWRSRERSSQIALQGRRARASRGLAYVRYVKLRTCWPTLFILSLVFSSLFFSAPLFAQPFAAHRFQAAQPPPCRFIPGKGPAMRVMRGGEFTMGSPEGEVGRDEDEGPQRQVLIQPFAIGRCEVTVAEFRYFVEATQYITKAEKPKFDFYDMLRETKVTIPESPAENKDTEAASEEQAQASDINNLPSSQAPTPAGATSGCWTWNADRTDSGYQAAANWRSPGFAQTEQSPVTCVSWHDAKAYIAWLNKQTGVEYRLPSEAEWEFVARAGTTTPFSTGECISASQANFYDREEQAYSDCSSSGEWLQQTVLVASYGANPFGLYGLHGNVWEWVEDCYHDNYEAAPLDGSAWLEEEADNCTSRVLRGGSWLVDPQRLRSATRDRGSPDGRGFFLGFRLARTL